MINKKKILVELMIIALFVLVFTPISANAETLMSRFASHNNFDTTVTVGVVIAKAIEVFLSLLSLIFIILILYAGFNWMTAAGVS